MPQDCTGKEKQQRMLITTTWLATDIWVPLFRHCKPPPALGDHQLCMSPCTSSPTTQSPDSATKGLPGSILSSFKSPVRHLPISHSSEPADSQHWTWARLHCAPMHRSNVPHRVAHSENPQPALLSEGHITRTKLRSYNTLAVGTDRYCFNCLHPTIEKPRIRGLTTSLSTMMRTCERVGMR